MPYYHSKDGGEILFWQRKCKICGKRWPITALGSFKIPEGMTTFRVNAPKISPGTTQYAKWADRVPGAGSVAGRLPNWPRWARILVTLVIVGIIVGIVIIIRGL
jgi:hypothetical protein